MPPDVGRAGVLAGRAGLIVLAASAGSACEWAGRSAIRVLAPSYAPEEDASHLAPLFTGADAGRARLDVGLETLTDAVTQPTDVVFVCAEPAEGACASPRMLVVEKGGTIRWFDPDGTTDILYRTEVTTVAEQGLLGLALHPRFHDNGRAFVNRTVARHGDRSEVVEIAITRTDRWLAHDVAVVMELEQPYQNHNGGQLAFGPDGMLYIGWGDGGLRSDPRGAGQDGSTWLGSVLRIDVDDERPYAVPTDNPRRPGWAPETWAIGVRNPWRFSFAPDGRMVLADVGQDLYEEVHLVEGGDNLGWSIMEGLHCYDPATGCARDGLDLPIWEYDHDEGQSITGGVVVTGSAVPALTGTYVFGDFISGRLWALRLPDGDQRVREVTALGKWPILPSAFGRDLEGNLVVADFTGAVYRVTPP